MNLHMKLKQRETDGRPIRVGMIGAGKFGTMFLAQAIRLPGIHVVAIADLRPDNARSNLAYVGWPEERYDAISIDSALQHGTTYV
ncbi:MAG: flagellar biosynthesis protein FlgA, partial [Alphaproteobacteria bacterium]